MYVHVRCLATLPELAGRARALISGYDKPAVFFLVRMRVREGGGGKEGKTTRTLMNERSRCYVVLHVGAQGTGRISTASG